MKSKYIIALCVVLMIPILIIVILISINQTFDGSRTGNDNQFLLDYKSLNKTMTHYIDLKQSDKLKCDVTHNKGELTISIDDMRGNNIYKNRNCKTDSFTITIQQTRKYVISVIGVDAKGSVHFVKSE